MDSMDNMMSLNTYIYKIYEISGGSGVRRVPRDPVCAAFRRFGVRRVGRTMPARARSTVRSARDAQCQCEKKKVVRPVGSECGQSRSGRGDFVFLQFLILYNFYNFYDFSMVV